MLFKTAINYASETPPKVVPVHKLRPRSMTSWQWRSRLIKLCGLAGAVLSATGAGFDRMNELQSGRISSAAFTGTVATGAALGGVAGLAAGYGGVLTYSALGGPAGIGSGIAIAAVSAVGLRFGAPLLAETALQPRSESVAPATSLQQPGTPGVHQVAATTGFNEETDTVTAGELVDRIRVKQEQQFHSPPFTGPWNDDVVYVGMNKGVSPRAAAKLRQQGARVTLITDSPRQDVVRFNGHDHDLSFSAGINAFVAQMGLPSEQSKKIAAALISCEKQARDELGQLALVWLRAERGGIIPSRVVLAGHSNGDGVWGDDNGSLRLGSLRLLAQAMPRAARQVEDAFVTGCYSGGEVTMEQYRLIFPQVRTIWAYESQAPGVDNGGAIDQAGWERATRGRNMDALPLRNSAIRKDMAIWNPVRGYIAAKPPLTAEELRGKVQWMQLHFFKPAFAGKTTTFLDGFHIPIEVTDPQTGLVRQYYSWLCRLTQNRHLPQAERAEWNQKKHQTIRLIYYSATVAPRFSRHYAAEIRRGYAAMGLQPPDYSRLRRGAALAHINGFVHKVQQTPNAKPEAKELAVLLRRGLAELDPEIIPDGWV